MIPTVFFQEDEIFYILMIVFKSEVQKMFGELGVEYYKAIKMLNSGESGGPDRLLDEFLSPTRLEGYSFGVVHPSVKWACLSGIISKYILVKCILGINDQ